MGPSTMGADNPASDGAHPTAVEREVDALQCRIAKLWGLCAPPFTLADVQQMGIALAVGMVAQHVGCAHPLWQN